MNEEVTFILDSAKEAMDSAMAHLDLQLQKVRAGKALAEISEVELGVVLPEEEILTPDQPTIGQ